MHDEHGVDAGFSHKVSPEEKVRMPGIDRLHGRRSEAAPGRDPALRYLSAAQTETPPYCC